MKTAELKLSDKLYSSMSLSASDFAVSAESGRAEEYNKFDSCIYYDLPVFSQTKDCALVDLETDNQRLKAELRGLQEDLAVQEEELAYQKRELQQLRQHYHQQETYGQLQTRGFAIYRFC